MSMDITGQRDVAALHALGATMVMEVYDDPESANRAVTGYVVSPDIDMAGYAAALVVQQRAGLIAYAADKRWAKEVSGITVSGIPILTDDRSKQMIMGARIAADADGTFTTPWVAADGTVVSVNATQIIGISNAVLGHVASCFAIFATVKSGIDGDTITTRAQIDTAFA